MHVEILSAFLIDKLVDIVMDSYLLNKYYYNYKHNL